MEMGQMGVEQKKKRKAGSGAVTHVGDGLGVGSCQAQVTDHLQAAVVGRQVQRSSAVLQQRGETSLFTDDFRGGDRAESTLATRFKEVKKKKRELYFEMYHVYVHTFNTKKYTPIHFHSSFYPSSSLLAALVVVPPSCQRVKAVLQPTWRQPTVHTHTQTHAQSGLGLNAPWQLASG